MGTLHSLADRRAARLYGDSTASAPDPDEVTHWKLLAERAGRVLGALEAAAEAGGHKSGLAALTAEAAGLRAALEDAILRRLAVAAIAGAAHARAIEGS